MRSARLATHGCCRRPSLRRAAATLVAGKLRTPILVLEPAAAPAAASPRPRALASDASNHRQRSSRQRCGIVGSAHPKCSLVAPAPAAAARAAEAKRSRSGSSWRCSTAMAQARAVQVLTTRRCWMAPAPRRQTHRPLDAGCCCCGARRRFQGMCPPRQDLARRSYAPPLASTAATATAPPVAACLPESAPSPRASPCAPLAGSYST